MRANGAAILLADYRSLGAPDLVCVSDKGEGWYCDCFCMIVNLTITSICHKYIINYDTQFTMRRV